MEIKNYSSKIRSSLVGNLYFMCVILVASAVCGCPAPDLLLDGLSAKELLPADSANEDSLFSNTDAIVEKVNSSNQNSYIRPYDKLVYVSSSDGDDLNDGLSRYTPKKTIAAGYALLRNNMNDWLLLKRGDVFVDEPLGREYSPGKWIWEKSGLSATKRMVITSYGSSREKPIIRDCVKPAMFILNKAANYVTVKNVHFYRSHFSFLGPMNDFTIQDCILEQGGVSCNSYAGEVRDFKMIRCAVIDAYSTTGHAQGVYFKAVNGLTIDKCLFDHNGWNEEVEGAERTMFNHNIYIQNGNKNVSVTNSIVSRGSSQGAMMRSGGVLTDNLFVRNAISASIGGGFPDEDHLGEGVVNEILSPKVKLFLGGLCPPNPLGFRICANPEA